MGQGQGTTVREGMEGLETASAMPRPLQVPEAVDSSVALGSAIVKPLLALGRVDLEVVIHTEVDTLVDITLVEDSEVTQEDMDSLAAEEDMDSTAEDSVTLGVMVVAFILEDIRADIPGVHF